MSITLADGVASGSTAFRSAYDFDPVDVTDGDLIVVMASHQDSDAPTVTDTAGNTYTRVNPTAFYNNYIVVFYAWACPAQAANVIHVSYASPSAYSVGAVQVVSGIDADADPFIQADSQENVSSGGHNIATSIAMGESGEYIVLYFDECDAGANVTQTGNATQLGSPEGTYFAYGYRIDTTAAVLAVDGGSGGKIAAAAFRAATGGGGPTTYYGASTSTWTLGADTAAKVTVKSSASSTTTLAATTTARVTAKSSSASVWALAVATIGRLTAKAASASTWALGITTAGTRTRLGSSSSTWTLTETTAGRVTAKAAMASVYTLTASSAALVTAKGSSELMITFTATTGHAGSVIATYTGGRIRRSITGRIRQPETGRIRQRPGVN